MARVDVRTIVMCAAASLPWAIASAQEDKPDQPEAQSSEDIIVTAQRREERLFEVPISITALSGEGLKEAGVLSARDLSIVTPGLNAATQGFALQPSIRGVSSTSTVLGDETNVAVYVDNIYSPFQMGNSFNFGDIERIEVLKGPQGTLFGRNATGGAIRVVTREPGLKPELRAKADFGSELGSRQGDIYVAGPLGGKVSGSLYAYGYADDGFVDNLTPGAEDVAVTEQSTIRGKLIFDVAKNFSLLTGFSTTNYITSTAFSTAVLDGVSGFANVAGAIITNPRTRPYEVALNFDPAVKTLSTTAYVRAEWGLGKVDLKSTTSSGEYVLKAFLDSDRTNIDLARFNIFSKTKVFTQEFEVASNLDGPVDFVGGVFYYDSDATSPGNENFSRPLSAAVAGVRTPTGPLTLAARTGGNAKTESWAAFGEVYWDVTDKLKLIGGYRYTDESKDMFAINLLSNATRTAADSWQNSSYRATAQYKFDDDNNVYMTYSTGFKSGVFNVAVTTPVQRAEPEEVTAWEVGVRSRLGPFTISGAAFDYTFENIQLQVNNILNPVAGTTILQNAATGDVQGAELQVGSQFTDNWSGQIGVSWLPTAEYSTFIGGLNFIPNAGNLGARAVAVDLSGSRIIRSPELTYNLSLNYKNEIAGGALNASATYFYSDEFFWIPGGAVDQDAYSVLNGRVAWTTPNDRVTVSLWGRNLTDELYWLQAGANSGGFSVSFAEPRTFGVGIGLTY